MKSLVLTPREAASLLMLAALLRATFLPLPLQRVELWSRVVSLETASWGKDHRSLCGVTSRGDAERAEMNSAQRGTSFIKPSRVCRASWHRGKRRGNLQSRVGAAEFNGQMQLDYESAVKLSAGSPCLSQRSAGMPIGNIPWCQQVAVGGSRLRAQSKFVCMQGGGSPALFPVRS